MDFYGVWVTRIKSVLAQIVELIWVVVIYLLSELAIWGLSRVMAPARTEFFASIFGMVIAFAIMTSLHLWSSSCDRVYQRWIKSKVDFINMHMSVGFPIPMIMVDPREVLERHEIASVVANFVITNLVSWIAVFFLAFLLMLAAARIRKQLTRGTDDIGLPRPLAPNPPRVVINVSFSSVSITADHEDTKGGNPSGTQTTSTTATSSQRTSMDCSPPSRAKRSAQWSRLIDHYPIFLSLFCILAIGAPVMAATGDSRVVDGCTLWFVWITAISMQRLFKRSDLCLDHLLLKNAVATLMNPVLMTTLIMTGYTRAKAAAIPGFDLARVLVDFSRASHLYAIWTSSATGKELPGNPDGYFGAGDAALSILEVGILIWGFKLYECRRQLYSVAGLLAFVVSVAAAAGNVFLSVACGHLIGLKPPEALAFAARSTTLALAKPAIEAVGGNMVANAALVVSNGILAQLLCPFALEVMGVKREGTPLSEILSQAEKSCYGQQTQVNPETQGNNRGGVVEDEGDDPMTIAAGVAIGINGAAMGVTYLYEIKSRAAPYAALSMTVFGVMTVIFTTVEPFKATVMGLAGL